MEFSISPTLHILFDDVRRLWSEIPMSTYAVLLGMATIVLMLKMHIRDFDNREHFTQYCYCAFMTFAAVALLIAAPEIRGSKTSPTMQLVYFLGAFFAAMIRWNSYEEPDKIISKSKKEKDKAAKVGERE